MGFEQQQRDLNMSRMQRLSATSPLRIVMDSATRVPPTPTPNRGPTTTTTTDTVQPTSTHDQAQLNEDRPKRIKRKPNKLMD